MHQAAERYRRIGEFTGLPLQIVAADPPECRRVRKFTGMFSRPPGYRRVLEPSPRFMGDSAAPSLDSST